jgi:lysophospholipase L1-like esterase
MAIASPFVLLALLEVIVRIVGVNEPIGTSQKDASAEGTVFFPEWDQQIQMPKPDNLGRVFVVGGSSALGFGVDEPFASLIQHALSGYQGRQWQVINAAMVGYGSHRLREVVRRVSQFDADAIVLYFGHNEYLEEVFYDPKGLAARADRLGQIARRSHLINWLSARLPARDTNPQPKRQRHVIANTNFPLIRTPEQHLMRVKQLEFYLRQILEDCREAHMGVLTIPAVPNLLAPPGDYAQYAPEWIQRVKRAQSNMEQQQWDLAVTVLEDAHQLDDEQAMSHYLLGLAELGRGNLQHATHALTTANALDKKGDRTNPDITETILRVSRQEGAAVLDLRPDFHAALPLEFVQMQSNGTWRLFLDHCHPSLEGHARIAEAMLPKLKARLP